MRAPASLLVPLAALAAACSGEDPSALIGARRASDTNEPGPAASPQTPAAVSASGSDGGDDAGTGGPFGAEDAAAGPDAAADAGSASNAFTGAPAYAATLGPSTRKAQHNFANNTPTTNPAGRACLNCHGPTGNATRFAFAGTVYTSAAGTTPAARVEVRARDVAGKTLSAYTDGDGNFFFPLDPNGDLQFPIAVGARDGAATRLMAAAVVNASCNACHSPGGGTPRIHVP